MNKRIKEQYPERGYQIKLVFLAVIVLIVATGTLNYRHAAGPFTGMAVNNVPKTEVTEANSIVNHKDGFSNNITKENSFEIVNSTLLIDLINESYFDSKNISANLTRLQIMIERTVDDIIDVNNSGYSTNYMTDRLADLKQAINNSNYTAVRRISEDIRSRKERAYNISDMIDSIKKEIEDERERGLNVSEPAALLQRSKQTFQEERFDRAESLLDDTSRRLDEIRAEYTMIDVLSKASKGFFARNWKKILITIAMLGIISLASYRKIRLILAKRELRKLSMEKRVINDLMKNAQKDHFKKGLLSESDYKTKMNVYNKRLAEIKRKIPELESMVKKN